MAMSQPLGTEDNSSSSMRETTNPLSLSSRDYDEWFVPPLSENLECSLCLCAFRDPVETSCQHIYCEDCILSSIRWGDTNCVTLINNNLIDQVNAPVSGANIVSDLSDHFSQFCLLPLGDVKVTFDFFSTKSIKIKFKAGCQLVTYFLPFRCFLTIKPIFVLL